MVQSVNFITNYLSICKQVKATLPFSGFKNASMDKRRLEFFYFLCLFRLHAFDKWKENRKPHLQLCCFPRNREFVLLIVSLCYYLSNLNGMAWHKISTCEGISIRMLTVHCHLCCPSFDFWASTYSTLLLFMSPPPSTPKKLLHVFKTCHFIVWFLLFKDFG